MRSRIQASVLPALLTLVLFCIMSLTVGAETVYSEGYFKYTISADAATVVDYFGSESEIVIPDYLAGLPVTRIQGRIFRSDCPVKKITVPDTVNELDDGLFTDLSNLKVVIVQSKNVNVIVPRGCVVIEDFPVYITAGGDENDGTVPEPPETGGPGGLETSGVGTGGGDGPAVTDAPVEVEKPMDDESAQSDSSAGNPSGSAGAGYEAAADEDGAEGKNGIAAANDSLITVDNTGNLIIIDRESNITVIDRSKKYGIAYDGDDTIIADENGERVYLGEEGTAVFYSDGEGGESVYRIQEPSSTADSGDPQSAQEGNGGSSNTVGIVIAVASAVAVPLMLMCFLCISRKRKGK